MKIFTPKLTRTTIPIYWFNAKRDDLFWTNSGRSPQLLNRMTTYNEVDNLTKNNKGIAVLGSRVESRNGMHAGHAMAVSGTLN